jgi:hypothetical protein
MSADANENPGQGRTSNLSEPRMDDRRRPAGLQLSATLSNVPWKPFVNFAKYDEFNDDPNFMKYAR